MLTTVERVAGYLGLPVTGNAPLMAKLDRLARAASDFVEGYCARTLRCVQVSIDVAPPSSPSQSVMIPETICVLKSIEYPPFTKPEPIDNFLWGRKGTATELRLIKGSWPAQKMIVTGYTGYMNTATVVASASVTTPTLIQEPFVVMIGELKALRVDSLPLAGQYSFVGRSLVFHVSDHGKNVIVTYGHVPPAVEQAVIDLTAYAHEGTNRIGVMSKSLGGSETVSFSQSAFTPTAKMMLSSYRGTFA